MTREALALKERREGRPGRAAMREWAAAGEQTARWLPGLDVAGAGYGARVVALTSLDQAETPAARARGKYTWCPGSRHSR